MNFYSLSPSIIAIIAPFAVLFSISCWQTALTLLLGAILCRGMRTVTGILRAIGLSQDSGFSKYHHILIILVGDGGFACAKLAWTCFKNNIALASRLKMSARIYALPEEAPAGKRGRKQKKGLYQLLPDQWKKLTENY